MSVDDDFKPKRVDKDNLKTLYDFIIPLKIIECNLTADEILHEWTELEKNEFPMTRTSSLLNALDVIDRNKGQFYFLPMSSHLITLVDTIHCVKNMEGGNKRITNLRNVLCTLVTFINEPQKQTLVVVCH